MEKNKNIALFIDCENISYKHIETIISELANYGEVNIRRAYGDWTNPSLGKWNAELFNYSLEPIHQPPYTTGKNASDIKMTIDIMKILCMHKHIDYIALATSDSDFTPLVTEIKSQGIQVIGFGEEKTSAVLQKACSEFIEVGVVHKNDEVVHNKKLINIIKNAINHKKGDDDFAYVSDVGTYIRNQNAVTAKKYGAKTWGEIIKKLHKYFEIKMLEKNGKRSIMVVKIRS